ncbi:hypothetical protein JCM10213_005447 [Rhodosporidiobolus nylandii]
MQSLRAPLSALPRRASPSSLASPSRRAFCTSPSCSAAAGKIGKVSRPARKTPVRLEAPALKRGSSMIDGAPQTELIAALAKVPGVRARPTLVNEEAARELVRAWGVDKMHDAVVVDTWAGPGGLTRAFLELPNVKKVIALEDAHRYGPMLDKLKEEHGDRFERVNNEPFLWESYTEAEKHFGDLVPKRPFDEVHPNLFLSAQLPNNTYGNLMFVQMLSAAAGEMWLYQYGRISMGFLGAESLWDKVNAAPGEPAHHKLSVLIPSLGTVSRVGTMSNFRPPSAFFHKPRGDPGMFAAVKVVPHAKPLVQNYEALEYITRNMFVTKAVPWHKALTSVCPGASNLIPKAMEAGITDTKKTVSQLSLNEWVILADIFEDWAFRPATLFDAMEWNEERI